MDVDNRLKELKDAAITEIAALKKKLISLSIARLGSFILICLVFYAFWNNSIVLWPSVIVLFGLFLFFLRKYADHQSELKHEKEYAGFIGKEELARADKWKEFDEGDEFIDPQHHFSGDLNVFGKYSLFQFINRGESELARKRLAQWLSSELLDPKEINTEKSIIKELSLNPEFLFRALAYGKIAAASEEKNQLIDNWRKTKEPPRSEFWWIFMRFIVPVISISGIGFFAFGVISFNNLLLVFALPAILVGLALKRHGKSFTALGGIIENADSIKELLDLIHHSDFTDPHTLELLSNYDLKSSSKGLKELNDIMGAIDSRNNVFVAIILNITLHWDFQCAYRLLKWRERYQNELSNWLDLANIMETYASPALYCFSHPEFTYASVNAYSGTKLESAVHILMDDQSVPNSFELNPEQKISIITGANMAGKSTYLRMIGTSMLLAMRGLPIRAESFEFKPMKLFTSMLTVDSLGDSESYFFSELKRLRKLVDHLEEGEERFVILDEILKGTNSKDKAEGSSSFLRKLLSLPAKGVIATHDLSLCELQKDYPENLLNQKFEIEYEGDELVFKYKVESGICQNMNASFLIKKMGLSA